MNISECKAEARADLGDAIFGSDWMTALLICFLYSAAVGVAGTIIPGLGAMILIGPLTFGLSRMFLRLIRSGRKPVIRELLDGFYEDFGQNFLIGLLTGLFVALWSLLFVIPGIVKYYAYSLAYFIKADHPDYGWRKCVDESRRLTAGHKGELFRLDLSFLGWYIVGSLCLGVGTLWVVPYHQAARAAFYNKLTARSAYTAGGGSGWYA